MNLPKSIARNFGLSHTSFSFIYISIDTSLIVLELSGMLHQSIGSACGPDRASLLVIQSRASLL